MFTVYKMRSWEISLTKCVHRDALDSFQLKWKALSLLGFYRTARLHTASFGTRERGKKGCDEIARINVASSRADEPLMKFTGVSKRCSRGETGGERSFIKPRIK